MDEEVKATAKPNSPINEEETDKESDEGSDIFCPALPPHMIKNKLIPSNSSTKSKVIGPTLPENYQPTSSVFHVEENESENEEDNLCGPIPSSFGDDERFNVPEMELRIRQLQESSLQKDNKKLVRESWMLDLPEDKPKIAALGLGSRQFRKKKPLETGDRSVWTDTPADKERKALKNKPESDFSIEEVANKRRDEELAQFVNNYTEEKRSVPLIESHRKKRAREEDAAPKGRKPFSREDDLHVNKFDDAQKETILKKSRQLNDRFSAGNKKFL